MAQGIQKSLYLMLDSRDIPLARGELSGPPDGDKLQVLVLDGKISEVMKHEEIKLVSPANDGGMLLGRILRHRYDYVVMERLQVLGSAARQNLRMPIRFNSFIYPITGGWKGRREVESNDLSCGGIAFFCAEELENGEHVEVVVPATEPPLVLRCEVLRRRPSDREEILYAGKFVDICNEEETLVREAVFDFQVQRRPGARKAR